jgi:hypothetical protein
MNTALPGAAKILNGGFRLDVATTPSLSISGLGHVPLLVSMMTGAQSLGVEVQAAYVASARKCAQSLRLSRVQFIAQDARDADLSRGTMFYLYSPFKGSILADVLSALRRESMRRSIKIWSLGPCTHRVSNETWLKASALSDTGALPSLTLYEHIVCQCAHRNRGASALTVIFSYD